MTETNAARRRELHWPYAIHSHRSAEQLSREHSCRVTERDILEAVRALVEAAAIGPLLRAQEARRRRRLKALLLHRAP